MSPARTRLGGAAAVRHLRACDPIMAGVIDEVGTLSQTRAADRPAAGDHYGALLRAITGQQLSTRAARAIYGRVLDFFGGSTPTPQQLLDADPEQLRAAGGLSRAKTSYLRSLAEHVLSGELELQRLDELEDERVIEELTAVRGLGVWTAHMFMMFELERPDVLAVGDLGIRKGVQRAYGLDELPVAATVEELAAPWAPHRTTACMYLWRLLDNQPG